MNDRRSPTVEEVADLLAFLPGFEDRDEPFATWEGGSHDKETNTITLSYPRYADDVRAVFKNLHHPPWVHYNHMTERTTELVSNVDLMKTATPDEIKRVLTWCARGERFYDGHRERVLEKGIVQAALRRLPALFPEPVEP